MGLSFCFDLIWFFLSKNIKNCLLFDILFLSPGADKKIQEVYKHNHEIVKESKKLNAGHGNQCGIVRYNASQEDGLVIIVITKSGLIGWSDLKRLTGYQR